MSRHARVGAFDSGTRELHQAKAGGHPRQAGGILLALAVSIAACVNLHQAKLVTSLLALALSRQSWWHPCGGSRKPLSKTAARVSRKLNLLPQASCGHHLCPERRRELPQSNDVRGVLEPGRRILLPPIFSYDSRAWTTESVRGDLEKSRSLFIKLPCGLC